MKETGVKKVKNVWKTKNNIESPNSKDDLLAVVDQIATLFSPGKYYYFVFSFESLAIQLTSEGIKEILGIEPSEMTLEHIFETLHPEDIEKFHEKENVGFDFLLNHIATEDIPSYKVVYLLRLKHSNGTYKTILHQSRTINVSNKGKVQQILCVHTDLTHLNLPMDHRMSFISEQKQSYYAVETT